MVCNLNIKTLAYITPAHIKAHTNAYIQTQKMTWNLIQVKW